MLRIFARRISLLIAVAGSVTFVGPVGRAADDAGVERRAANVAVVAHSPDVEAPKPFNPRVLFITSSDCTHCADELARLQQAGGEFEKMQARGWKIGSGPNNHLQIVDREALSDLVEQLADRELPTVVCVDDGHIVRSFKSGCTTPLDAWTFGFLAKGVDERPPGAVPEAARVETTGHYSLRGNHWSVDDDWSPTRAKVISHLRGPNHGHQIAAEWEIETWSYEELRSLHDNLHEREMGGVSFGGGYAPVDQFGAGRKAGGK